MNETPGTGGDGDTGAPPGSGRRQGVCGGASAALFGDRNAQRTDDPPELAGFEVIASVGAGGYGTVWSAWQSEPTRRRVAVKVLRERFPSPGQAARFDAEAHILARLRHPGIAAVFLSGADARGRPCIVMELVDGRAISSYCDERRLAIRERVSLVAAVARALQHAHACMVLHCDVKPSNILVCEVDGMPLPKVIDFGISRSLAPDEMVPTMTLSRGAVGTIEFMAPEQMAGKLLDVRTDIYGLGAVMHALLCGALPHDVEALKTAAATGAMLTLEPIGLERALRVGGLDHARLQRVAMQRATTVTGLTDDLRGELDWIVRKALDPNPDRRYATASEMAEDLEAWLDHRPVRAAPPSRWYRLRKLVRRNPVASGAVTTAVVAVIAAAVVSTLALFSTTRQLARVEALQGFEESILLGIDPGVSRGYDTQLLALIVDRAAEGVQSSALGQDPALLADKELVLTRAYAVADKMKKAAAFAERAEATSRRAFGDGSIEHAESLSALASVLSRVGDAQQGAEAARRAVAIRSELLGVGAVETIAAQKNLALCLDRLGKAPEAEVLHRAVLAGRTELLGPDHQLTLEARRDLAESLRKAARVEEALVLATEYLEGVRRTLGPDSVELVLAHNNVGTTLIDLNRLDEALPHLEEAIKVGAATYGPRSLMLAIFRNNLAAIYRDRGELDTAQEMYEALIPTFQSIGGMECFEVFVVRTHLANLASLKGEHASALEQHRAVMADKARVLGAGHRSVALGRFMFAEALERAGDLADASREFESAASACASAGIDPTIVARSWVRAVRLGGAVRVDADVAAAREQARLVIGSLPAGSARDELQGELAELR